MSWHANLIESPGKQRLPPEIEKHGLTCRPLFLSLLLITCFKINSSSVEETTANSFKCKFTRGSLLAEVVEELRRQELRHSHLWHWLKLQPPPGVTWPPLRPLLLLRFKIILNRVKQTANRIIQTQDKNGALVRFAGTEVLLGSLID